MVKNMHSKWADACGQIIAFDRALTTETNLTSDPFCCHIVRLFSQMSAMATMRLHIAEAGESVQFELLQGATPEKVRLSKMPTHGCVLSSKGAASGAETGRSSARVSPSCSDRDRLPNRVGSSHKLVHSNTAQLSLTNNKELATVAKAASMYEDGSHKKTKADKISELSDGISKQERELLLAAPCPVFATAQRIQRAIITRLVAGGMRAPPPIISRIFQEVSNGLLFYNNATKMKEVPVPFPYVQLNALLLNLFSCFLSPIAIASFTPVPWLSVLTTFMTVISFYGVFLVANQLEDPFGSEANDMPMIEYHEEFCASLCAVITQAWLPEDTWLVKEGKWVQPRNVALAANAFSGRKYGRYGVQFSKRPEKSAPKPYNTLLNRAKRNNKPLVLPFAGKLAGAFGGFGRSQPVTHMPSVVVGFDKDETATIIQRAIRKKQSAVTLFAPRDGVTH